MVEFVDEVTPINRANMMAIQGFVAKTTVFNDDGTVTQTNDRGEVMTTHFNNDGSISQSLIGAKTIHKLTRFNDDGSISEVIS